MPILRLQTLVEAAAAAFYPRSHRLAADDYGDDEDENQDGSTSGGKADDQVLVDTVASKREVGGVTTVENKQIGETLHDWLPVLRSGCNALHTRQHRCSQRSKRSLYFLKRTCSFTFFSILFLANVSERDFLI